MRDAVSRGRGFESLGREPWLRIRPDHAFLRGRIAEVRYSAGAVDQVVRPMLRFVASDGQSRDTLMPAPGEGIGIWRGRVPDDTADVWISPTVRFRSPSCPCAFCR